MQTVFSVARYKIVMSVVYIMKYPTLGECVYRENISDSKDIPCY